MQVGVIIQARTSSQRLPAKVLIPVAGKLLLEYVIERVQQSGIQPVIVATSDGPEDQPVARIAQQQAVHCFRGPLHQVASRFLRAADEHGLDAAVRISGDSPLLDPHLINQAVQRFRAGDFDLVTNIMPRTFPRGQSVEVIRTESLRDTIPHMVASADQEHVTRFFYKHPKQFRIENIAADADYGQVPMAVDSREDLRRFSAVLGLMTRPHYEYSLPELSELYQQVNLHGRGTADAA